MTNNQCSPISLCFFNAITKGLPFNHLSTMMANLDTKTN